MDGPSASKSPPASPSGSVSGSAAPQPITEQRTVISNQPPVAPAPAPEDAAEIAKVGGRGGWTSSS